MLSIVIAFVITLILFHPVQTDSLIWPYQTGWFLINLAFIINICLIERFAWKSLPLLVLGDLRDSIVSARDHCLAGHGGPVGVTRRWRNWVAALIMFIGLAAALVAVPSTNTTSLPGIADAGAFLPSTSSRSSAAPSATEIGNWAFGRARSSLHAPSFLSASSDCPGGSRRPGAGRHGSRCPVAHAGRWALRGGVRSRPLRLWAALGARSLSRLDDDEPFPPRSCHLVDTRRRCRPRCAASRRRAARSLDCDERRKRFLPSHGSVVVTTIVSEHWRCWQCASVERLFDLPPEQHSWTVARRRDREAKHEGAERPVRPGYGSRKNRPLCGLSGCTSSNSNGAIRPGRLRSMPCGMSIMRAPLHLQRGRPISDPGRVSGSIAAIRGRQCARRQPVR